MTGMFMKWGNLDIDMYRWNMMGRDIKKIWSPNDPVEMCVSLNQKTYTRMLKAAFFLIAKN